MQNLKKNWLVVYKMTRIWWILIWALKGFKNLHFDWYLSWKVCNVWSKKYRGVIFHDTREWCKIWKKADLRFWKIAWGFRQVFNRALESWDSKLELLWGTFIWSRKCYDKEEKCKIWKNVTSSKLTWGI